MVSKTLGSVSNARSLTAVGTGLDGQLLMGS